MKTVALAPLLMVAAYAQSHAPLPPLPPPLSVPKPGPATDAAYPRSRFSRAAW